MSNETLTDGAVRDRNIWRNDRKQELFVLDPGPLQACVVPLVRMSWTRDGAEQEENGGSGKSFVQLHEKESVPQFQDWFHPVNFLHVSRAFK